MRCRKRFNVGATLCINFTCRRAGKFVCNCSQRVREGMIQYLTDCTLPEGADRGEFHAVGRQDARERMNEDAGDAERVCDKTRMLAGGASETGECVAPYIITARD